MNRNNNYQQLPLPADQHFQQNVLESITQFPRTNGLNISDSEAQQIHCELINRIQMTLSKGPIRIFMFNLMSDNRYNNQAYHDLFSATTDYYYYLLQTRGHQPLPTAVDQSINAEIANIVQRFPALEQYITPDQVPYIQSYMQIRDDISNTMRQFTQGIHNGNNGYTQSASPMQNNFQQQQNNGYPQTSFQQQPQQGQFGMSGNNHPQQSSPVFNMQSRSPQSVQTSMLVKPMRDPNQRNANTKPIVGRSPRAEQNAPSQLGIKMKPLTNNTNMYTPAMDDGNVEINNSTDEIDYRLQPIDTIVEFSNLDYPLAFRSNQMQVTEETDGVVKYVLVSNLETSVDYSDHELNSGLIKLARPKTEGPLVSTNANWPELTAPNEVGGDEASYDGVGTIGPEEPVILTTSIDAYSLAQAHVMAASGLDKLSIDPIDDRLFEYYVNLKTPVLATAEDLMLIKDVLLAAVDLTDLNDRLIGLNDEISGLTPRVWYQIHDRLTEVLNRRLAAGISSTIDVDTFTGDYEAAMKRISTDFSSNAIDRFKRNTFVSMMNTIAISELDGGSFIESQSVTQLPWLAKEIDLVLENEHSMLSKSVSPDMYTAIVQLVKRTSTSATSVNRRFLVTLDNVWIEIHNGDIGIDTILISKVKGFF